MIPLRLEIHNFLPYRDPEPLDFEGIHVACLTGQNGAGKSALLDAMTWAIWGKARDGKRSDDELVHHGQDEMRVTLEFGMNDQRYRVMRQRKVGKRGQSILELQVFDKSKWRGISEGHIRETQRKIDQLLRLDYDTFTNSAFLMQGRADAFTLKTPAERKTLLATILGLEQWSEYERAAKDRAADFAARGRAIDHEIESIEAELGQRAQHEQELAAAQENRDRIAAALKVAEEELADVTKARADLAQRRRELESLQLRLTKDERELREIETELADAKKKSDTSRVEEEMAALKTRLAEMDGIRASHDTLNNQRLDLVAKVSTLTGANSAMEAEADPLKNRITLLEEATDPQCPTCSQPLDDNHRHQLVTDLQQDLKTRRTTYRENREVIADLNKQVEQMQREIQQQAAALKEQPALQKRMSDLQVALAGAEDARANAARLSERQTRWQESIVADRETGTALQDEIAQLEAQVSAAEGKMQAVETLRFEGTKAEQAVGAANQKLAALEGYQQMLTQKQGQRAEVAQEQAYHDELRVAFGKQGVPAMIIEAAVPEIEQTANDLLSRMTHGRMNVRFETQRETKKGDVRETLDIKIADELGDRSYEMYSGGEAFRINFAIRIAISKLLARRAGAQLRTLIIDEGFGTQDAQGREHLIDAINNIQDDFERIVVITHIEELKDSFPIHINVQKADTGSYFEIS